MTDSAELKRNNCRPYTRTDNSKKLSRLKYLESWGWTSVKLIIVKGQAFQTLGLRAITLVTVRAQGFSIQGSFKSCNTNKCYMPPLPVVHGYRKQRIVIAAKCLKLTAVKAFYLTIKIQNSKTCKAYCLQLSRLKAIDFWVCQSSSYASGTQGLVTASTRRTSCLPTIPIYVEQIKWRQIYLGKESMCMLSRG